MSNAAQPAHLLPQHSHNPEIQWSAGYIPALDAAVLQDYSLLSPSSSRSLPASTSSQPDSQLPSTASPSTSASPRSAIGILLGGPSLSKLPHTIAPLKSQFEAESTASAAVTPADVLESNFDLSKFLLTRSDALFGTSGAAPIPFESVASFDSVTDTSPGSTWFDTTLSTFASTHASSEPTNVPFEFSTGLFECNAARFNPAPTVCEQVMVTPVEDNAAVVKQAKLARLCEIQEKRRLLDEENVRLMAELEDVS
jgi:hypothetical protein